MKKIHAALLGASALAAAPRAVAARPRAETPTDPKAIVEQINADFSAFKDRLAALEKKDDVVTAEQVERINASITELTGALETAQADLAAAKLGAGAGDALTTEAKAHATAFNSWFRKGREPEAGMRELEVKAALTTQSDPDGGYLVPEEMEKSIDRVLGTVSAIRGISRVITIGGQTYKKLVSQGGASSGWVSEQEARPETDTPTLREIAFNAHEIYANPAATQTSLDDSYFNVEQWLAEEVSIEFAEQEGDAFINGNGVNKPRGFLAYPMVANAAHQWGKIGFVKTGAAAAFAAEDPCDAIIDLYYALKAGYRNGAQFVTSDAVMGTVRKFKDGQGNYLWAPPTGADMPATILGKPVVTDDNMPALGAGAFPMAFGNFQRGYLIVDRQGARVLRDPYTNKPFVHFYTTKRVGGGVANFEAIKVLKCSA